MVETSSFWDVIILEANRIIPLLIQATYETFIMTFISLSIAAIIGIPLGVLLVITRPNHILEQKGVYLIINGLINMIRAVPFIILLFAIIPFTRWVAGTTIGIRGVIVPLVIFTFPFIARITESALLEVNRGIIEAFLAMGATPLQIIRKVLLRESRSTMVLGLTMASINLIGASAMAGMAGSGGLGDLAIRFGYQQYDWKVMLATVIVLIIIVQGLQGIGNFIANKLKK